MDLAALQEWSKAGKTLNFWYFWWVLWASIMFLVRDDGFRTHQHKGIQDNDHLSRNDTILDNTTMLLMLSPSKVATFVPPLVNSLRRLWWLDGHFWKICRYDEIEMYWILAVDRTYPGPLIKPQKLMWGHWEGHGHPIIFRITARTAATVRSLYAYHYTPGRLV